MLPLFRLRQNVQRLAGLVDAVVEQGGRFTRPEGQRSGVDLCERLCQACTAHANRCFRHADRDGAILLLMKARYLVDFFSSKKSSYRKYTS